MIVGSRKFSTDLRSTYFLPRVAEQLLIERQQNGLPEDMKSIQLVEGKSEEDLLQTFDNPASTSSSSILLSGICCLVPSYSGDDLYLSR